MKIPTNILKELDRILDGNLPASREGIGTLARKLKDQIVQIIKIELEGRRRE